MEQSLTTNTIWLLLCTALVFLMQAGFCCLESGLSRSKNSINVTLTDNGQIAFDLAIAATEENHPFDEILMDMQMPVTGGIQGDATTVRRQLQRPHHRPDRPRHG